MLKKLLLLCLLFSSPALALTSTINPGIPAQGAPISSAPLRQNFTAAYNDINNIYSLLGTGSTAIGSTITGGTNNSILFVNPNAVIAQDNTNFSWNDVLQTLNVAGSSGGFINANGFSVGGTYALALDIGIIGSFTQSYAGAGELYIQNTSANSAASSNLIVANNLDNSATTYYGDFGINSSTYIGSGSINLPNATFLYSQNGDLVLGTGTANNIHFYVNGNVADSLLINTASHIAPIANGTPAVSSCGTTPSITGGDVTGVITTGTGAPTSCTITFSTTYTTAPVCIANTSSTSSIPAITANSVTAITIGLSAGLTSGKIYYHCFGN